jgi:hypothetical protein
MESAITAAAIAVVDEIDKTASVSSESPPPPPPSSSSRKRLWKMTKMDDDTWHMTHVDADMWNTEQTENGEVTKVTLESEVEETDYKPGEEVRYPLFKGVVTRDEKTGKANLSLSLEGIIIGKMIEAPPPSQDVKSMSENLM